MNGFLRKSVLRNFLKKDYSFFQRKVNYKIRRIISGRRFCPSVQSLSRIQLFATPWTSAHQASLSITNSLSLPKLMSIELVMPSNHLILCHPLLLLPSIFHSIRVFLNESALRIRWPKYQSFSFSIIPSNEHSGLISFRRQFATAAKSLQSCPTLCDPIDGSPPGSPVPGILQARTLEWVAISFSSA